MASTHDLRHEDDAERLARELAWERRARALLQDVALAASDAGTLEAALAAAVERICARTGWPVGHVYVRARDGSLDLVSARIWHLDDPARYATFRRVTEETRMPPGVGLPGRVLAARRPAWIPRIAEDANFPRASLAADIAVKAGFAFPVLVHGEVAAVLEFFAAEEVEPDPALIEVVDTIGRQLGRVLERLEAEGTRRALELRFRSVTESAPDSIVAADASGRIVSWNRAAEKMFGWTEEEVLGTPVSIIVPERYRTAHDAGLGRVGAGGEHRVIGRTIEIEAVRRDGRELPVELSLATWRVGDEVFYSGIIRDVSERKEALAQLQAVALRLEAKEREAREASAAKSVFLANMSHELRTPLNGVVGMVDLLMGTRLDERQRHYAEIARASATLLASAISGVLDFSKVETGRLELEEIDFAPSEAIEEATAVAAHVAEDKGVELHWQGPPSLAEPVRGDPGRLRQMLLNLVSNAVKFTERGEVAVRAQVLERGPEGSLLRFEVADTGIGIPRERLDRLFQPFSQVDVSTTRRYGGTGLGLAIVKQLAEMMGGRVGVESEPGRGSRFWFTARFGPAEPAARATAPDDALRGLRVLAVDDHATNREILEGQLGAAGARCVTAASGEAALEALLAASAAAEPFHVAILDLHMPGMDGLALAAAIRAHRALAGTPLVLLSSASQGLDLDRLGALGIDCHVPKPLWRARLFDAVARAVTGRAAPRSTALAGDAGAPSRPGAAPVLIVEDNEVNQEVLTGILERLGVASDRAATGLEALARLRATRYGLVLMDCQLPEMDGFEVTRRFRAGEPRPSAGTPAGVPVVAVTASATREDVERCRAAGMDAFLAKPVDAAQLAAIVERFLGVRARVSVQPDSETSATATSATETSATATSATKTPATKSSARDTSAIGPVGTAPPAAPPRDEAPVPAQPPPIDRARLLRTCIGDEGFARQLLGKLRDRLPGLIGDVEGAASRGDVHALGTAAHVLRGAAANVSAGEVLGLSSELEAAAREGDLARARAALAPLRAAAERCRRAIAQEVDLP